MKRRFILKSLALTPLINCLNIPYAFGCSMDTDSVVIPSSTLPEPMEQLSFQLFTWKFRSKFHWHPRYNTSNEVAIKINSEPENGLQIPVNIRVNINKLKEYKNTTNHYCKKIYVYCESEGRTIEQLVQHKLNQAHGGVLWTHFVASYEMSRLTAPEIQLRLRHVGILMSVCVVAEVSYLYNGKEQVMYLYNISERITRSPCYYGALSSNT